MQLVPPGPTIHLLVHGIPTAELAEESGPLVDDQCSEVRLPVGRAFVIDEVEQLAQTGWDPTTDRPYFLVGGQRVRGSVQAPEEESTNDHCVRHEPRGDHSDRMPGTPGAWKHPPGKTCTTVYATSISANQPAIAGLGPTGSDGKPAGQKPYQGKRPIRE